MILTIAMLAFFLVTVLFILDASREQVLSSEVSTFLQPFAAETIVKHRYNARPDLIWNALTELAHYNFWFPGVLRILPAVETDRYVHRYSFDKFNFSPGAVIRLRPFSLSPTFKGKIISVQENKQLALEMRFNPVHKETVVFSLEPAPEGTTVTCRRTSRGVFSWITLWGFSNNKSKILDNLGYFIPEDIIEETDGDGEVKEAGPQYSREAIIARAVQAGLDGNMDLVNEIPDKPTRGMAKAMLVQSKRKGNIMPEHLVKALSEEPSTTAPSTAPEGVKKVESSDSGLPDFVNTEDLISYVVNKALDGDDESINAIKDKATRGKAKAMVVKIKRGSIDRPEVPEVPTSGSASAVDAEPGVPDPVSSEVESEENLISRLVTAGLDGNMDEINALESRVLRGKIKAAIVKEKRVRGL